MPEVSGARVIAQSLKEQGVGDLRRGRLPVVPIAIAAQKAGVPYYGFRNEQSASYAPGVRIPDGTAGACLAVSGPGMIHAIAGLANAQANCWPMLLIGGANDSFQNAWARSRSARRSRPRVRSRSTRRGPTRSSAAVFVEAAVRASVNGRPGRCTWTSRRPDRGRARGGCDRLARARGRSAAAAKPIRLRCRVRSSAARRPAPARDRRKAARGRAPRTRCAHSSSARSCRSWPRRWEGRRARRSPALVAPCAQLRPAAGRRLLLLAPD